MSTNYYLKRIPTQEEIDRTKELLDKRLIEDVSSCMFGYDETDEPQSAQEMIRKMTEQIHIGKYSGGWRFLFHTHLNLYQEEVSSVFQFIGEAVSSGKWKLIDEYREDVDVREFKNLVKTSIKEGITAEQYDKMHPEYVRSWGGGPKEHVSHDRSRWWDVDFS